MLSNKRQNKLSLVSTKYEVIADAFSRTLKKGSYAIRQEAFLGSLETALNQRKRTGYENKNWLNYHNMQSFQKLFPSQSQTIRVPLTFNEEAYLQ